MDKKMKRAFYLYKTFKAHTREYQLLAEKLGYSELELNRRFNSILYANKY